MVAYLHNDVYDNGLSVLTSNTETVYLLSADPGLTWANIANYALGSKSSPSVSSPADRTSGGREVTISEITDGTTDTTGTATHYAVTDDSASKIFVSQALSPSKEVVSGNDFTLGEITVGIPGPVS